MKRLSEILEADVLKFRGSGKKSSGPKSGAEAKILQLHPDEYTATEMPATHKTAKEYNMSRYQEVRAYKTKFPSILGKDVDQVYKHYKNHAIYSTDRSDLEPGNPMSKPEFVKHLYTVHKIQGIKNSLRSQINAIRDHEPSGIFGKKKDPERREWINQTIKRAREIRKQNTDKM